VSQADRDRERLIETYRKKARHYDLTSRFYPAPGYPQHAQRSRAVQALGLHAGDQVVDIACGTGLNFPLIEQKIGQRGRIIGVDLTDAMLARAQSRIEANGWSNVGLVQSDATGFGFPAGVDAVLSTYAMTQVPDCGLVIANGAAALSRGGRWVVLDLKLPDATPAWLSRLGIAVVPTSASLGEWVARRPWESIRAAMQENLARSSWTELCFGTAFLAVGSGPGAPHSAARSIDGKSF
jgi:demethylmenaquinone methyltransferase/2-methoxy-6-polyprenyl-1,4-benzoquinol methylase